MDGRHSPPILVMKRPCPSSRALPNMLPTCLYTSNPVVRAAPSLDVDSHQRWALLWTTIAWTDLILRGPRSENLQTTNIASFLTISWAKQSTMHHRRGFLVIAGM